MHCIICNEPTKNDWVSHETDEGIVCLDCAGASEDESYDDVSYYYNNIIGEMQ